MQLMTARAQLLWVGSSGMARVLWDDDGRCGGSGGCRVECATPVETGRLSLRAERALILELTHETPPFGHPGGGDDET
jgi:hypothetical protein